MPEPLRVALVADTHGQLDPRVEAVARACALVVHAGDIGGAAILRALAADGARVVAVSGNNDSPRHWPAEDHETLAALPATAMLNLPGGGLQVVHGHRLPAHDRHRRLRERFPDAGAIVLGHSHRRVIDRDQVPWILNPGAAGRSRAYGGPGCLILTATAEVWTVEQQVFERRNRRRVRAP